MHKLPDSRKKKFVMDDLINNLNSDFQDNIDASETGTATVRGGINASLELQDDIRIDRFGHPIISRKIKLANGTKSSHKLTFIDQVCN